MDICHDLLWIFVFLDFLRSYVDNLTLDICVLVRVICGFLSISRFLLNMHIRIP